MRDLLLNELELWALQRLHGVVDGGTGALLVDRDHGDQVGHARVKVVWEERNIRHCLIYVLDINMRRS